MKNYIKIFFVALIALGAGLVSGYFIFNKNVPAEITGQAEATIPAEEAGSIYTCSMHPQIRQGEPGLCPLCNMDLIPFDDSPKANNDPAIFNMTEEALQLANVRTTIVGKTGEAQKTITLNGKIQADERTAASQVSHLPGRIEKLYITYTGASVNSGQRLADIYSPSLVTAQQELLEALKLKDFNPSLAEAARQKLSFWKIPESTIAEIESSGQIKETFTILADASGVVTERLVSVGDYVKTGEVLFNLVNLNRLWVIFDAYEEDLTHLRNGDIINFSTPAAPNQEFATRITFIDPVLNPATRTAAIRAEVKNHRGSLKPEMFVRGIVAARTPANTQLTVPKTAVLWTGERSVVWVKVSESEVPSFAYREVQIGEGLGNQYLVESGLHPGDEVVTNGAFVIDAAAQLNNQQSMMNKGVLVKKDQLSAPPDFSAAAPEAFKDHLHQLAESYLLLKNAFVETDAERASQATTSFLKNLDKVDFTLLSGEAHNFWQQQETGMQSHAIMIEKSKDVEAQREQFDFLSQLMISTLQAFGTGGHQYYIQFCPMAIGDKGASWLSNEESIENPYYGDKMLKCGTVRGSVD